MTYNIAGVSIKETQAAQLEILNEFDSFCREHNLKYILYAGTMLGAVRHSGFIPWDDDIDVAMPREDYDKFIKKYTNENKTENKYFLQDSSTEKLYLWPFAKLRKNNTIYKEAHYENLEIHQGLFIDIFPLDNFSEKEFQQKLQQKVGQILMTIISSKMSHKGKINKNWFIKKIIYVMTFPINKTVINSILNRLIYLSDKSSEVIEYSTTLRSSMFESFKYNKKELDDLIEVEFENNKYFIPRNYDELLKKSYGNYMEMPDEKDRYPHHDVVQVQL